MTCTCATVAAEDARRAIQWMRASDPAAAVTLDRLCHVLGTQTDCHDCVRLLVETLLLEGAAPGGFAA